MGQGVFIDHIHRMDFGGPASDYRVAITEACVLCKTYGRKHGVTIVPPNSTRAPTRSTATTRPSVSRSRLVSARKRISCSWYRVGSESIWIQKCSTWSARATARYETTRPRTRWLSRAENTAYWTTPATEAYFCTDHSRAVPLNNGAVRQSRMPVPDLLPAPRPAAITPHWAGRVLRLVHAFGGPEMTNDVRVIA